MIDQIISLGNNKNIVTLEIAGELVDLEYPSHVPSNTPFGISYGAKNISTAAYTFFGYLEDEIGIIPGTEWQMDIEPNGIYHPPVFAHPGIDQRTTLTLTLGHIEEPECSPDGITDCVGYDLYTCVDGYWELTEQNSATCGYIPPPEVPWMWIAIGASLAAVAVTVYVVAKKPTLKKG